MEAVLTSYTEKSALATARATFDGMMLMAIGPDSGAKGRIAERLHQEGVAQFNRLESRATDVALSPDAALAFDYYIEAARRSDAAGQIAWLEQLPSAIAKVLDRAQPGVEVLHLVTILAGEAQARPQTYWRIRIRMGITSGLAPAA